MEGSHLLNLEVLHNIVRLWHVVDGESVRGACGRDVLIEGITQVFPKVEMLL